ncbi:hypothetical protein GGX14DRAFT_388813 [Mycena pura]|uniref:Uncharacterized protein n=1 Tax=Mycena pura TaxID=153505 RepID=A0AAD6VVL5_9AGAR|nr:hypothetical protein GGX14DRAFT_388813 [Mycena pura]
MPHTFSASVSAGSALVLWGHCLLLPCEQRAALPQCATPVCLLASGLSLGCMAAWAARAACRSSMHAEDPNFRLSGSQRNADAFDVTNPSAKPLEHARQRAALKNNTNPDIAWLMAEIKTLPGHSQFVDHHRKVQQNAGIVASWNFMSLVSSTYFKQPSHIAGRENKKIKKKTIQQALDVGSTTLAEAENATRILKRYGENGTEPAQAVIDRVHLTEDKPQGARVLYPFLVNIRNYEGKESRESQIGHAEKTLLPLPKNAASALNLHIRTNPRVPRIPGRTVDDAACLAVCARRAALQATDSSGVASSRVRARSADGMHGVRLGGVTGFAARAPGVRRDRGIGSATHSRAWSTCTATNQWRRGSDGLGDPPASRAFCGSRAAYEGSGGARNFGGCAHVAEAFDVHGQQGRRVRRQGPCAVGVRRVLDAAACKLTCPRQTELTRNAPRVTTSAAAAQRHRRLADGSRRLRAAPATARGRRLAKGVTDRDQTGDQSRRHVGSGEQCGSIPHGPKHKAMEYIRELWEWDSRARESHWARESHHAGAGSGIPARWVRLGVCPRRFLPASPPP